MFWCPFADTTEQGLLQSLSGYCPYFSGMTLQLKACCYCLSPSEPPEAMQGTDPGWQGAQQPATTTCSAHSSQQEPQHRHNLNTNQTARLDLPVCSRATVSFTTQTLILCSSEAEPTQRHWRSRAFPALWQVPSLHNAFAEQMPVLH